MPGKSKNVFLIQGYLEIIKLGKHKTSLNTYYWQEDKRILKLLNTACPLHPFLVT